MSRLLALGCVMAMAACGSAESGDDFGTGTNTLSVDARVEVDNVVMNAVDANDFSTSFEVTVRRDGVPVVDAVVVMGSDGGDVELTLSSQTDGEYRGGQVAYHRGYSLDVDAGDDFIHGVRLVGPDIHAFASPGMGETVQGGEDLLVTWDRKVEAEVASIDADEMDRIDIADTGEFLIPADGLEHDQGEVNENRIRLWRSSHLVPDGGVPGSSFSIDIRNEIEILVAP
jgi:hypothetical protein